MRAVCQVPGVAKAVCKGADGSVSCQVLSNDNSTFACVVNAASSVSAVLCPVLLRLHLVSPLLVPRYMRGTATVTCLFQELIWVLPLPADREVYQGMFGPWSIEPADEFEVWSYRVGLTTTVTGNLAVQHGTNALCLKVCC